MSSSTCGRRLRTLRSRPNLRIRPVAVDRPALVTLVDPGKGGDVPAGAKIVLDPSERGLVPQLAGLKSSAFDQFSERVSDAVPGLLEVDQDGAVKAVTHIESSGAPRVFLDPISGAQRLIIVGAGHIAQPLATMGSMLGFHVTVIDDRASFANRERFPTANEIIVRPFAAAIASLKLDRHCYLISVTRGHAFDEEAVRAALKQPGCFIGMIGSRRRVKATLARIEEDGVDSKLIEQFMRRSASISARRRPRK